jgi:KUP system potassium uptake protein
MPINEFIEKIVQSKIYRADGVGVHMERDFLKTPLALIQTAEHLKKIPKFLIFVSVEIKNKPRLSLADRYQVTEYKDNFFQLIINYGF